MYTVVDVDSESSPCTAHRWVEPGLCDAPCQCYCFEFGLFPPRRMMSRRCEKNHPPENISERTHADYMFTHSHSMMHFYLGGGMWGISDTTFYGMWPQGGCRGVKSFNAVFLNVRIIEYTPPKCSLSLFTFSLLHVHGVCGEFCPMFPFGWKWHMHSVSLVALTLFIR